MSSEVRTKHVQDRTYGEYRSRLSRKGTAEEENTGPLAGEMLLRELNAYRANGCGLKLNGRPSCPETITRECLREHHDYMRDIIPEDSHQGIREINFVRVRKH